jgi:CubicO group peptidase (beta-lactamase class C family)
VSAPGSGASPEIHGRCDSAFGALKDAFRANFVDHEELGAALAVTVDRTVVADIWAGWADSARTRPWQRDTLVDVFSVGKPMAATCLLILVDRGEVELDRPVADYWPQFAAAGKRETTVRMVLAHRAGLPALRRRLEPNAMYDWEQMASALAREEPWWEPGTRHGYHVNTFGFLVGEIVRRVSGEPIGSFFQKNVAAALGADFHFGLPAAEHRRVAEFLFPKMPRLDPGTPPSMIAHAYMNPHGLSGDGTVNTAPWRQAEMPSSNGHSNARAVASIYSALGGTGSSGLVRVLAPATLAAATSEASCGQDAVLERPSRFGLGFQLTQPERPLGPSPNTYGHFGAGGSLGFADPDAALSFGYTPNHGLGPRWQNPRNRALLEALYSSMGDPPRTRQAETGLTMTPVSP